MQYIAPLIAIVVCWTVGGLANAYMDLSSEGRLKPSLNKANSWLNKWKLEDGALIESKEKLWYYFGLINPKYIERFPYSSTLFVAFTDFWHFMKLIMLTSLKLSVCLPFYLLGLGLKYSVIVYLILTVSFWIGFYIYKLKKWK